MKGQNYRQISQCRKNRVDASQLKIAGPMGRSVIKFVAVGHIVNDSDPRDHLGGGVSYSAIAAQRLGHEAHIITKCPPDHPYIAGLEHMGVRVHLLPTKLDTITSFKNIYDQGGQRTQYGYPFRWYSDDATLAGYRTRVFVISKKFAVEFYTISVGFAGQVLAR
jgi:sugar/nucleoside kinase (ribokinase family)